jgi:hypothetical protein
MKGNRQRIKDMIAWVRRLKRLANRIDASLERVYVDGIYCVKFDGNPIMREMLLDRAVVSLDHFIGDLEDALTELQRIDRQEKEQNKKKEG